MNKRILELAEQAGVPKEYSFVEGATVWDLHPSLEQFAELIVRECFDKMESEDSFYGQWMGRVIKEHFGVEE
jgi:hypothetical protein